MAKRSLGIRCKLIGVSTLLLVVVIGLFGLINSMQSRRIIDDFSRRLEQKTTETLKRSGVIQLRLLAETARVALVQRDHTTLRAAIRNVAQQSNGAVTTVAVVDQEGTVLAHSDRALVGKKASGLLARTNTSETGQVIASTAINGVRSMAFTAAVKHGKVQLATVFLAYSLEPLDRELATTARKKKREIHASLRSTMIVGILALLVGVILTVLQGVRLSRPLMALAKQADRIAKGDLEARVSVTSADEVGALGERFNFMAEQMTLLMRETSAKATMEKELELASTIQSTLVPDANVAELNGFDVAGYFRPATKCGGDWWGHYTLSDGRTLVMIGDVTGHGVGAAMITAAAQGAVLTKIDLVEGKVELKDLMRTINSSIHATAKGQFMMTCFASIYDPKTRRLSFANAGHNFPYRYDLDSKNLSSLVVRGNRLGERHAGEYEVEQVELAANEAIIWYTDGIIEGENMYGEEFGERRFRGELQQHAGLPPALALQQIVASASQFYDQAPQKDDITVVVARFS